MIDCSLTHDVDLNLLSNWGSAEVIIDSEHFFLKKLLLVQNDMREFLMGFDSRDEYVRRSSRCLISEQKINY